MSYYGSMEYAQEMAEKARASAQSGKSALDTVGTINKVAAWRANKVSEQAQQRQYEMNLQMMREANALQASMFAQSMAFNSQQSDLAWERSQQNWNQTANYNAQQNLLAQQYNTSEAEKQRQWQEHMSNTSYQRAMEDMRKAGLNPMLAFMQGGASTPVGSSGSISGASMSNLSAQKGSVGSGSAHAGSVSSFSGALENTSNMLATVGAIADLLDYFKQTFGNGREVNTKTLWKQSNSAVRVADQVTDFLKNTVDKYFPNNKLPKWFWKFE